MERALTRFIRALRSAGADVSSTEAIDAARTVALVGYADREVMKTSLSMVLAKSEEEKVLHDHLFDVFFKTVETSPRRDQQDDPNADSAEGEDNSNLMPGQGESQGQGNDDQDSPAFSDDTPADAAGGDPDAGKQQESGSGSDGDAKGGHCGRRRRDPLCFADRLFRASHA
jgi:uncharacterized protein with von Willebrand factor type A (vWA) domain